MASNEPGPSSIQRLQPEAEGKRARDRAEKKLQHGSKVHPFGYSYNVTDAGTDS